MLLCGSRPAPFMYSTKVISRLSATARQSALSRSHCRPHSTKSSNAILAASSKSTWSTKKVLLVAAAAAASTYAFTTLGLQTDKRDYSCATKFRPPKYGTTKDMESVGLLSADKCHVIHIPLRLFTRSDILHLRRQSAPMLKIFTGMAILNGHLLISTPYQWL